MPSIDIRGYGEALAENAGADGTLTVVDSSKYWAGCHAWLSAALTTSQKVIITDIVDATHIQVRPVSDSGSNVNTLSYAAGGNLAGFTTAHTARIDMPDQLARIDSAYNRRVGV